MSVESPNPSSPSPRGRRRVLFGIGLAALVLGALSGVGVLYVMETRSGNEALTASSCPPDAAVKAALDAGAKGEVAAVQPLDTPFDASTIAFKDGDDKPTTLAELSGRTLLVNLWATWCVPCRAEMPALDALERERGDEAFAVVPINVDLGAVDKPKAFYEENGLKSLPLYRDETMGVFNELKARGLALGLPVTLLVDPKGCARGVLSGPAEWASPDALRLIDGLKGLGVTRRAEIAVGGGSGRLSPDRCGQEACMGLMSVVSAEVDEAIREEATAVLAERGLTVSDAIRIVLARVAADRTFANGLVAAPEEPRRAGRRSWDDFFDSPGIDIEEPDDPPPQVHEAF